jgi:hypothetical protein
MRCYDKDKKNAPGREAYYEALGEDSMIAYLKVTTIFIVVACITAMPSPLIAQGCNDGLSKGQTFYVPAYSHIYIGNKKRPFDLAVTLSIRNIDLNSAITLTEVNYYGSQGNLVKSFVDKAETIKPQESLRFVIAEDEKNGGSGANFIVKWTSTTKVNSPIIESIMIGTRSSQGISFTSRGRAISSN